LSGFGKLRILDKEFGQIFTSGFNSDVKLSFLISPRTVVKNIVFDSWVIHILKPLFIDY
jgi:hypothetical protein